MASRLRWGLFGWAGAREIIWSAIDLEAKRLPISLSTACSTTAFHAAWREKMAGPGQHLVSTRTARRSIHESLCTLRAAPARATDEWLLFRFLSAGTRYVCIRRWKTHLRHLHRRFGHASLTQDSYHPSLLPCGTALYIL
jgi:hypothetical protein